MKSVETNKASLRTISTGRRRQITASIARLYVTPCPMLQPMCWPRSKMSVWFVRRHSQSSRRPTACCCCCCCCCCGCHYLDTKEAETWTTCAKREEINSERNELQRKVGRWRTTLFDFISNWAWILTYYLTLLRDGQIDNRPSND